MKFGLYVIHEASVQSFSQFRNGVLFEIITRRMVPLEMKFCFDNNISLPNKRYEYKYIMKIHHSLFSRQTKISPYFQGLQKFVSLELLEIGLYKIPVEIRKINFRI